jgi:hypothetical protein
MRSRIGLVLAAAAALVPSSAFAQSESAIVGWVGLITTPVGAFAPVAVVPRATGVAGGGVGVQARYSHWQFASDDDNTSNFGLGLVFGGSRARTTVEIGQKVTQDCSECSVTMLGADVHVALRPAPEGSEVSVGLNPAFGVGKADDFTSVAVAVSLPVMLTVAAGSWRVTPFVSPGAGFTWLSGSGESETGSRAMISGGVAFGGSRVQGTLSARRILIEDGVTVFGLGISIGR